jgi:hypothetical protein
VSELGPAAPFVGDRKTGEDDSSLRELASHYLLSSERAVLHFMEPTFVHLSALARQTGGAPWAKQRWSRVV